MAVNLPPQYHDAEARYKKARTPEEKLAALREMWVILPKHKASEKLQAQLKTTISEITDEIEQARLGPKRPSATSHKIPRQGAGQIVFLGPPNAGKSLLLSKLTKAKPEVAAYPFTTQQPMPGMMDVEEVKIQLIDLPPITADVYDPMITDFTRAANAAVLFLDLADDDGPAATQCVVERLSQARRKLVTAPDADDDPAARSLPTLLVANKCDADAADVRLEIAREQIQLPLTWQIISAERGDGLEELKRKLFEILCVIRIYSKLPGKPPDRTSPFTVPYGATVADFAGRVHQDFEEKLKSARVWGGAEFDGQTVGRDHVLHDRDVVELHL